MGDWLKGIEKYKDSSLPKMVLGNKEDFEYIDDKDAKFVKREVSEQYFKEKGLNSFRVSAKSGIGIKESLSYIVETVYKVKMDEL